MTIPSWIHDAVFYQIFPDRFFNGNKENDPNNIKDWDSEPTFTSYFGGDLEGINQKLDYLQDLGVNALYLNPIFLSTSPHGYNTSDYFKIEPRLGSEQDFRRLVEQIHERGMHIILDGVFNHTGRGFFAFVDILENGEQSPYFDWYHINHFPLHAYEEGKADSYQAWFDMKSLPKLNTDNPKVCNHILQVIEYWLRLGVDGWRLDVPNEIDSDHFWSRFQNAVKGVNPDAYIVGEIWHAEPRWVKFFDGLMDYPFRDALLGLLNDEIELAQFIHTLQEITTIYNWENVLAMYVLLGSHDTKRLYTKLNGDVDKIKLAFMLQFFFPGIPAIYYGDEIGMQGGKDPGCRAGFMWDETQWNNDLRNWLKALICIRKEYTVLQYGSFEILKNDPSNNTCIMKRQDEEKQIFLVMNFSQSKQNIDVETDTIKEGILEDLLSNVAYSITESRARLELAPMSGSLLNVNFNKE